MSDDMLSRLARECDARFRPKVGDKVMVAAFSRLVVEVNNTNPRWFKSMPGGGMDAPEGLAIEIIYLEQFMDRGYNPTHHSCTLAAWRTWAQFGHEGDRIYR